MNDPRDALVGDALRRLDVPDHAPDFWSRLDGELAADRRAPREPGAPGPHLDEDRDGAEVIELATGRAARRSQTFRARRAPAVAAAAAVAAALALGFGLPAVQQAADGDAQVDLADQDPAPAPDAMQPAPEVPSETETTTRTAPDPAATMLAAEELAGEWLTALRAGAVEAAWGMLDEVSRAALPLPAFRDDATALAEGAGVFAGDATTSTAVLFEDPDGEPLRVVTFTGEVQREGLIEFASYPVAITGPPDALGVRFAPGGPTLEIDTELMTSSTISSPLPLLVATTAEMWVSYDGRTPEPVDQAGQASIELDVTVAGGGGTHIVTLVGFEGGQVTVRAYPVMVP